MSRRNAILHALLAAGSFVLGLVFIWLLYRYRLLSEGASNHLVYGVLLLQEVALIGLPAWFLCRRDEGHVDAFRGWWQRPDSMSLGLVSLSAVGYTLAGALIVVLWLQLLSALGLEVSLEPGFPDPMGAAQYALAIISAAVVPAFCEELMFRGLMQTWIERRWGSRAALLIPSLLFALLHLSFQGFASLVVIGLVLGKLRQLSGGLWLPIAFHGIYNTAVIIMNAAAVQPGLSALLFFGAVFLVSTRSLFARLPDRAA